MSDLLLRPRFVDWHDARLDSVTLLPTGQIILEFTRMTVFQEIGRERYEVAIWKAQVKMLGVSTFSGSEAILKDGWVVDGKIVIGDGRELELAQTVGGVPARTVELALSDGGRVLFAVSQVELILRDKVKRLRDWEGPLSSD